MEIIPARMRNLWSAEEIHILVLASLFLQVILIFLSLFRKRSRSKLLSLLLWSAYLGANFVATLALGNILNKQNEGAERSDTGDINSFWAPFLLLHLGGPDTITAYSVEDNELWLRHLLGLVVHVLVAIFIFLESLPSPHLWAAAMVVLAYGILKYGERTWSLWSASGINQQRSMVTPDQGPNFAKFMQEYQSRQSAGLYATLRTTTVSYHALRSVRIKELEAMLRAYFFFQKFKALIVNLSIKVEDRIESQKFFLERYPLQAFQVVEMELSFLHDYLFSKACFVHTFKGRIMRTFSLSMPIIALLLFHHGKHPFEPMDITISYVLLVAAIVLELAADVMLVFSDWTIMAILRQKQRVAFFRRFSELLLKIRYSVPGSKKWWSNSIGQYNLIRICLQGYNTSETKKKWKRLLGLWQLLKKLWDTQRNVNHVDFSDDAKKLIFQELKNKTNSGQNIATDYKLSKAFHREWVLLERGYCTDQTGCRIMREFDEKLLMWHIATYLLYEEEEEEEKEEEIKGIRIKGIRIMKKIMNIFKRDQCIGIKDHMTDDEDSDEELNAAEFVFSDHREISKQISDYMMYLVVFEPALLPAGIGKIRFQDTCADAMKFFSDKNTEIMEELMEKERKEEEARLIEELDMPKQNTTTIRQIYDFIKSKCTFAWNNSQGPLAELERRLKKEKQLLIKKEKLTRSFLLRVDDATIEPKKVKGDKSKSVLWDACKLAKALKKIKEDTAGRTNAWNIISVVWVEMLCYAASNCSASAHVKKLNHGGEILTHIWLLMAHMESSHSNTCLFVNK